MVPNLRMFIFLQLDKFEGAEIKHDNFLKKIQSKITQINIFGPKFKDFYFRNKTIFQNNFPIPCVYYLCSQRFLYLLKSKSNYQDEK